MQANIQKKISESVSRLNVAQQRRILSFIESLSLKPKSKSEKNPLLMFAGTIDPGDLRLMEEAIRNYNKTYKVLKTL